MLPFHIVSEQQHSKFKYINPIYFYTGLELQCPYDDPY